MSYEILCWIGGAMMIAGWGLFWFSVGHACATDRLRTGTHTNREPRVLAQERRTHQSTGEDTPNRRFIDKYSPKATDNQAHCQNNHRTATHGPMCVLSKTICTEMC